jgi:hypothetical protein
MIYESQEYQKLLDYRGTNIAYLKKGNKRDALFPGYKRLYEILINSFQN